MNISWGKGDRCIGLTTLPPSCAGCVELLQLPGPAQGLHYLTLPLLTSLLMYSMIVWPCIITFLVNKTNRCTEFQSYGITTLHVSGSHSAHHQESLAVHRLWYTLCTCDHLLPRVGWNYWLQLRSQLLKVYQSWRTAKDSWWWAERLPETCRVVILIKLEFSASVGFIHKETVDVPNGVFLTLSQQPCRLLHNTIVLLAAAAPNTTTPPPLPPPPPTPSPHPNHNHP